MSKRHTIDIDDWVWQHWCTALGVSNPASQLRSILGKQTAMSMVELNEIQVEAARERFDAGTTFVVSKTTKCNDCREEVPKGSEAIIFRNANGARHIVHTECK